MHMWECDLICYGFGEFWNGTTGFDGLNYHWERLQLRFCVHVDQAWIKDYAVDFDVIFNVKSLNNYHKRKYYNLRDMNKECNSIFATKVTKSIRDSWTV